MRQRTLILAGAGMLALAIARAANPAGATTASWVKDPVPSSVISGTMRLYAPAFEQTRVPESSDPEAPLAPGDRLLWTAELFDGGTHVGSASRVCTAVDDRDLFCTATAVLPQGQVQLQAVLDHTSDDLARFSVVGGSDCYRYVQGQVVVTSHQDGSSEWSFEMKDTCAY